MNTQDYLAPNNIIDFVGIFRLTGRVAGFDSNGTPYARLRLSSCNEDHVVLINLETTKVPEHLSHFELVAVSGTKRSCTQRVNTVLCSINKASNHAIETLPALHTLPRTYCPVKPTLDLIVKAVRSIESIHLQNFVRRVLERRDKLESLLNAPASKQYHHAYSGGLLVHSLEVARTVVGMIKLSEPSMPRIMQETGFVAGLLHDIGKTFTYDAQGKPLQASSLCSHDDHTLEACAYGLAYLDKHDSEIATTLRHIWTCASPGARYGHTAAMTLARYVRDADGQSAMADNQKRAFKGRLSQGFGRIGANCYWLPTTEHHAHRT